MADEEVKKDKDEEMKQEVKEEKIEEAKEEVTEEKELAAGAEQAEEATESETDSEPTKAEPLSAKDESLSIAAEPQEPKVEEPVKKEESKPEPVEESPKEDEYLEMMKKDEEDKKAELKAEEDEPKPEKDIAEELSQIKIKIRKPKIKKKEIKQEPITEEVKETAEQKAEEKKEEKQEPVTEESADAKIYALRTTANREDQVMDFVTSNAARKKLEVYSVIRPHGMRGYIFLEAGSRSDAEQAAFGVPYARGVLPNIIQYSEIEHMLEQIKKEVNIQKNDIAEIISGPFKREKCKITRIDKAKEEVVVELLEAAVPIPITVKMDAVRVIRRDKDEEGK